MKAAWWPVINEFRLTLATMRLPAIADQAILRSGNSPLKSPRFLLVTIGTTTDSTPVRIRVAIHVAK